VGGGSKSLKNNNLNTYTQVLDDGLGVAEIEEIIETPENNEYLASLGLSSKLVEEYPYDVTTIIVYKKNKDNSHTFDKIVYIENFGEFELTSGQNYTLLLHGGRVDDIQNKENFNDVYIENYNLDFKPLVQRIDNFVPDRNKTNVLPIKMKYPGTHVTLLFDATDLFGGNIGKKITLISTYGHNNDNISFLYGDRVITRKREIEFKGNSKLLVPIVLGNTLRKDLNINFSFKTEDSPEIRTISIPLRNLRQCYKQTIRIKLRRCGAYLRPDMMTDWRQFMCHNLGVDYNLDPFTPSADIHGDKYQWGYKTPIIKQKDDVYQSGPVPGWNTIEKTNTWDNGIDDPCPEGYRVPTLYEWVYIGYYKNTSGIIRLGTWSNTGSERVANAGVMIGNHLMLPAAGIRERDGSTGLGYGTLATYWGIDTDVGVSDPYLVLLFNINYQTVATSGWKNHAMPVRCIKKE